LENKEPSQGEVDALFEKTKSDAESAGYHLNPDAEFAKELIKSLLINEKRYGYQACPCRLSSGKKEEDLDIICPCDYRDPDLGEFSACYCALYVSAEVLVGARKIKSIPERRPNLEERKKIVVKDQPAVWRCKVCGYLCSRTEPPEVCPICKAKKDRFEPFNLSISVKQPVWRCKVCGYLCARTDAPETCPICKVKKDRFERLF
jgi:ferredoxin-thioredoxin reductase catalytic subunit/rubredoxin